MFIYLIINNNKKFLWLDVTGVKDPLSYIKRHRLCPALIEELHEPVVQIIATPATLTASERVFLKYKQLINPEYND